MSQTWADKTERQMRADRERRRAARAKTWAERTEHEQRAEALERGRVSG
jgi:hypothetical protein